MRRLSRGGVAASFPGRTQVLARCRPSQSPGRSGLVGGGQARSDGARRDALGSEAAEFVGVDADRAVPVTNADRDRTRRRYLADDGAPGTGDGHFEIDALFTAAEADQAFLPAADQRARILIEQRVENQLGQLGIGVAPGERLDAAATNSAGTGSMPAARPRRRASSSSSLVSPRISPSPLMRRQAVPDTSRQPVGPVNDQATTPPRARRRTRQFLPAGPLALVAAT